MNLKLYYQNIRDVEMKLEHATVVLVSHETPDGGRAGIRTEVPRQIAAKMIVDGRAHVATPEEAHEFDEQKREAQRVAEQTAAASRMHVTVISPSELRNLRNATKSSRD